MAKKPACVIISRGLDGPVELLELAKANGAGLIEEAKNFFAQINANVPYLTKSLM